MRTTASISSDATPTERPYLTFTEVNYPIPSPKKNIMPARVKKNAFPLFISKKKKKQEKNKKQQVKPNLYNAMDCVSLIHYQTITTLVNLL